MSEYLIARTVADHLELLPLAERPAQGGIFFKIHGRNIEVSGVSAEHMPNLLTRLRALPPPEPLASVEAVLQAVERLREEFLAGRSNGALSVVECAKRLSRSRRFVYNHVAGWSFAHQECDGGKWLISAAGLEQWIAQQGSANQRRRTLKPPAKSFHL